MKKIGVLIVYGLGIAFSWAQVLTPAGPALPSSGPTPVLAPDGAVLSPGAVLVPLGPVNNVVPTVDTNQPAAPVNTTDLASILLNLRFVIDRALPRLAAYNGTVQSINSGTNLENSVVSNVVAVGSTGVNLGANVSQNLAAAATGANLSGNVSSVVGATPTTGVSADTTTASLMASQVLSTNTSTVLTTQETINSLQVLQDDLTQAESILNALSVGQGVAAALPPTHP